MSDRWAAVNPESANSALVTTGGRWELNISHGWKSRGSWRRRASPSPVDQRRALRTSPWGGPPDPPTAIRYPTTPCSPGGRPVEMDVRAAAVVLGATVVIGPPARLVRVGATPVRSRSWSQPSPSSTRSRIRRACRTSPGNQVGAAEPSRRAGTRAVTQASW